MSLKAKVLIGFGLYILILGVLVFVVGVDGKNDEFQPQNEFFLDPWITIDIAGIDLSINKAVLYLLLATIATIGSMTYIANRMQREPNKVQMAVELSYDLTRKNITGRQPRREDVAALVPIPGDALLLHLVLEHDRLPAAADEHRAPHRRLRRRDPGVRALCRNRQPLDPACPHPCGAGAPTTSRASGPRASSPISPAGCPRASRT